MYHFFFILHTKMVQRPSDLFHKVGRRDTIELKLGSIRYRFLFIEIIIHNGKAKRARKDVDRDKCG